MDRFVNIVKPSTTREVGADREKQRPVLRYNPYGVSKSHERRLEQSRDRKRTSKILAPLLKDGGKPSSAALTKHLLNTLSDESNPITHSDIYERSDHISSAATGHQRSDRRVNQKSYWESRSEKLAQQLPEKPSGRDAKVLSNVLVYINGYLDGTTDTEMKRIVTLAGGQILHTASGATHILTSQQLSGAKTQKLLTTRSKSKVHVVKPEWVTDSIGAGKRLSERGYSVINDTTTRNIADMFDAGTSRRSLMDKTV
ncbi:hypothetical protein POSPLADRAFT_1058358 [Postia placenta MAD-698-R-SB12]|uniref:BRCT domain-containing protein n=1 Tax=Postia placenta MAD-698-R-SB12 TaxID=670580 RepID=A0A1X6MVF0_9APHY|nr:hypothetical protein POSPLADRAFT_1058358 [Postia placenta MAD-698-R-SB12]OSX60183.1 hypothetical protein POSPLADRAFT_1058358 [Postia placenta MAD-698-R-SB12]